MKNILTLTEIIFKGRIAKLDLKFLEELILKSDLVRFNTPEVENMDSHLIIDLLNKAEYADLAFDSVNLDLAPNIFANLVLIDKKIELLFFLDLKDIKCKTHKEAVDIVIVWSKQFSETYNFDTFQCQVDNADEGEFLLQRW